MSFLSQLETLLASIRVELAADTIEKINLATGVSEGVIANFRRGHASIRLDALLKLAEYAYPNIDPLPPPPRSVRSEIEIAARECGTRTSSDTRRVQQRLPTKWKAR